MIRTPDIIGIDIGKQGAAVKITPDRRISFCRFMRNDLRQQALWFQAQMLSPEIYAYVEKVDARRGEGGPSAHSFGKRHGEVITHLAWANIPWEYVSSSGEWHFEFCVGGVPDDQKMRVYAETASRLFPEIKVTHDLGAAILIAEYGWRKFYGVLTGGKIDREIRPGSGLISIVELDSSGRARRPSSQ